MPEKAFRVVLQHIEAAVLDGRLTIGSTLPAERELAASLGVSRAAVREAIRALEAQGVLSTSVGAGAAGGTKVTPSQSAALTRMLRLHVALADFPVHEVVELRVVLERLSVTLAVACITGAELAQLGDVLYAMEEPAISMEDFNELDTRFHVLVAEAARNRLVTDLTVAVRESLRLPILDASREMVDYPGFRGELLEHHREIYDAMVGRDSALAADLLESHIRKAYEILPTMRISRTVSPDGPTTESR